MLNKREIQSKIDLIFKDYLSDQINNKTNGLDYEKRVYSLAHLISLKTLNTKLKKIYIPSLLPKKANKENVNSLMEYIIKDNSPINDKNLDVNYIDFLIDIVNSFSTFELDLFDLELYNGFIKFKEKKLVNLVREFYNGLPNDKIKYLANKILGDSSHYGFTKKIEYYSQVNGSTSLDFVNNKPYISVKKTNNIDVIGTFAHEVMHCIDFYLLPKLDTIFYTEFKEFPSYFINYLINDYLFSKDIDSRIIDTYNLNTICNYIFISQRIKNQLQNTKLFKSNGKYVIDNKQLIYNLLSLESYVLAYSLYDKAKKNLPSSLNNLVNYMQNPIKRDKIPNFSYIGLSNSFLLEKSKKMDEEAKEMILKYSINN